MFKANLIEDPAYYELKRKVTLIGLPASLLTMISSDLLGIPFYWNFIVIGVFSSAFLLIQKLQKGVSLIAKNRKIEISDSIIILKSKEGITEEEIDLSGVNRIIVKSIYTKLDDKLGDLYQEIKGDFQKNFLIVEINGERRKFEFLLESHYMIVQIKKLINHWKGKGYCIQTQDRLA